MDGSGSRRTVAMDLNGKHVEHIAHDAHRQIQKDWERRPRTSTDERKTRRDFSGLPVRRVLPEQIKQNVYTSHILEPFLLQDETSQQDIVAMAKTFHLYTSQFSTMLLMHRIMGYVGQRRMLLHPFLPTNIVFVTFFFKLIHFATIEHLINLQQNNREDESVRFSRSTCAVLTEIKIRP